MFILEEPYVSDLLAATVAELGLPVLDTPMARRRLVGPHAVTALRRRRRSQPPHRSRARGSTPTPRTPSAGSPSTSPRRTCRDRIGLFKDKVAFRELVADLYPDYRFFGLSLAELRSFDPARVRAPFIVKPAVGFFSMGVHVVESAEAWPGSCRRDRARGRAVRRHLPGPGAGPGPLRGRGGHPTARSSRSTRTSTPTVRPCSSTCTRTCSPRLMT